MKMKLLGQQKHLDNLKMIIDQNGQNARSLALQTADEFGVATPADWRPGDDVIIGPAGSCGTAKGRMEDSELDCKDWFFCTKKLDKDTVLDKVLKRKKDVLKAN